MQTQTTNTVQIASLVIMVVLLLGGLYGYLNDKPQDVEVNFSEEELNSISTAISNKLTPGEVNIDVDALATALNQKLVIDVPEIEMPDTILSVREDKEDLSKELALDEITEKDFKDDLVEYLITEITEVEDIDRKDITNIDVRDSEVDVNGKTATVELELKVEFNNYGDEDENEYARVIVEISIEDLDRDDDYEDADVDEFEFIRVLRTSF